MPSSPRTNADTDVLNEIHLIWGGTDDVQSNEWSKLDQDFTNAGYREGITAGKEAALQEGFDDGFARIVPLGRELGLLRGAVSAAMGLLSSSTSHTEWGAEPGMIERCKDEVKFIADALGHIHLEDIGPPDVEAERHAREHLEQTAVSTMIDTDIGHNLSQPVEQHSRSPHDKASATTRPAVEELKRYRTRLANVFRDLGLEVALT